MYLELFPEDSEMRLVCSEPQHNEICIGSVKTVSRVGVMVRLRALTTDIVHDLVFSLPWNVGVRQDDLDAFPSRVVVKSKG